MSDPFEPHLKDAILQWIGRQRYDVALSDILAQFENRAPGRSLRERTQYICRIVSAAHDSGELGWSPHSLKYWRPYKQLQQEKDITEQH